MRPIAFAALFSMCACITGKSDLDDTGDTIESDADADADADTDTDVDTDTGEPLGGFLQGTVVDMNGAAVAEARVSLCATVCRTTDTDSSGGYRFDGMEQRGYVIDVIPMDDSLATILITVTAEHEEELTLDFTVPELSAAQNIPNNTMELELTDGLFVSLGFDILDMGFSQATTTSAVQVPESAWPLVELEGVVKALWYLAPFDVETNTVDDGSGGEQHISMDFRIANSWGWSAGTTLEAWEASYDSVAWKQMGTVEVNAEGTELSLTEGDGLTVLSTLLLLEPSGE